MSIAVSFQAVSKRFKQLNALDQVSFDIHSGAFFGLLGPNGAGKTTLINTLAGLVRADSGTIRVMGHDVVRDYRAARACLGVVPQELVFDPFFTVRETLRLQSGYYGVRGNDAWIDEILDQLDLTEKAETNMRALSGGMKRRVLVAQALVHRPPVIILDEPTAGVDVELRQSLWQFIKKLNIQGHTVLLTTHYLEEAQTLCDRIAMLKAGRVVALDSTENLLARTHSQTLKITLPEGDTLTPALKAKCRTGPSSQHAGRALELEFQIDHAAEMAEILAQLHSAGKRILNVELTRADLEQAFLDVMRQTQ